jgi:hypothetical protein
MRASDSHSQKVMRSTGGLLPLHDLMAARMLVGGFTIHYP